MLRYLITATLALGLVGAATAQQEERAQQEQEVRQYMQEFTQRLAQEPQAYIDQLSFPIQLSIVTENGEVVSGTFEEDEYRLLVHMARTHASEATLMQQLAGRIDARAEADAEALEEDGEIVEEELTLRPFEELLQEVPVRPTHTEVQFVGEDIAFVRTTLAIGEEPAGERAEAEAGMEAEEGVEDEELEIEEELAVQPERGQAEYEVGALLVREEGEWRVKSLIRGETRLHHGQ